MRVYLDVQAQVAGVLPVAVPWFGGETVTVDHDVIRRDAAPMYLALETNETGEVLSASLGTQDTVSALPLRLVSAFLGPDSPERRAGVLLMRDHRASRVAAQASGDR